jgi:hypothetical protein
MVRGFCTLVAEVAHPNADGSSRQKAIESCWVGEKVVLVQEKGNPRDPNALRVCRKDGVQLGYVGAHLTEEIVKGSHRGLRYDVFVKTLTGGTADVRTRGVNLLVVVSPPGATEREAKDYIDRAFGGRRPTSAPGNKKGCLGLVLLGTLALLAFAGFIR